MATPNEIKIRSKAGGFSGVDISAVVRLPAINGVTEDVVYQLGSIHTLSYSVYTAKSPVKSLGFRNIKSLPRGTRTVAGTMVFNQINQHPLDDIGLSSILNDEKGILTYSSGSETYVRNSIVNLPVAGEAVDVIPPTISKRHMYDFAWDTRPFGQIIHPSELPPFDIILLFVNEIGNIGKMIIYGVDLISEGSVLSVEDIYTEVTYQYQAKDIEYFHAVDWDQTEQWRSRVLLGIDPEVNAAEEANNAVGAAIDRATQAFEENSFTLE